MASIHPSLSDVAHGRVGTRIKGKWLVDKLLGVGGMGAVYAATHRNGSRVALKVLHPQLSMLRDIRLRFAREGYAANTVNHPGVVRVLDDDETEDGSVFLVMELLDGETVDSRARRFGGRLPIEDVAIIADGLLDVMAAAHEAGIVHRDIKPDNVFITRDHVVKVLDFGVARLREASLGEDSASAGGAEVPHLRTRTGVTIGTPAFMAPEQALGRTGDVDALSDLWSVGATIYALVSGRIVHDAKSHMEVVIAAATAQAKSLATVAAEAPKSLVEIVDRALAFKKEERWPNARAMQAALRQALPATRATQPGAAHSFVSLDSPPGPPTVRQGVFGSQPPSSTGGRWSEERKLATVLFGDIIGFSTLANDLEPDGVHDLAKAFFGPLAREVEREGGTVLKYIGDKIVAVFGVPVAHEDDPARALRAAMAMIACVRRVARERGVDVALRVGVNTGLVMVGNVGGGTSLDVMGATANLAGWIEEAAAPSEILVGSATERLVRDAFELSVAPALQLKGSSDPVAVFRVDGERESDEPASSVRLRSASGTPFFSRRAELELLLRLYDAVAGGGELRIAELVGEMGMGKSHLLRELRIALGNREPTPIILHATRVLGGVPLGFVGRMLRARFNVRVDESPEAVRARVVDAVADAWSATEREGGRDAGRLLADLVAPTPVAPLLETELSTDVTRTVSAFAEWVKKLAAQRPVLLLIEQLQWTDRASCDLLHYLSRVLRRERVFLVVSARPEPSEPSLGDREAPRVHVWTTASDIRTRIVLEPFTSEVMGHFLDDLLRLVPSFPRDLKRELVARAEGNPEMCKELVRLLVDRGALAVDERRIPIKWDKARAPKLDLPDTVRGVLQARLDGLQPAQKDVLKVASVVGRIFWFGALRELLEPQASNDELATLLDALKARELVKLQPTSSVSGEREYAFATKALCDAAYELVPRTQAVALHRRVADWLGARGELWEGGHANLAAHLEAAGDRARARRLYLSAARHAVSVSALSEAIEYFDRVSALWEADETADERISRAGVLRERAIAQARSGRFDDALASLDAAEVDLRAAGISEQDPAQGWILVERGLVLKEYGRVDDSIAFLGKAIALDAEMPASLLGMRAHAARAFQRAQKGELDDARLDVAQGLKIGGQIHLRDAAWHMVMARLRDAEGSIYFHSSDLERAEQAFRQALELRELAGDPLGIADDVVNLGGIAYTRGQYQVAAAYYERALLAAKKLRWAAREAIGHSNLGQAKLALGDLAGAAAELEIACRQADEGEFLDVLADSARALAEVCLKLGDLDAAITHVGAALRHAERAQLPVFVAMAHATAMDVHLARLVRDRDRTAFELASTHKDEACAIFTRLGQASRAATVTRRFGEGSNATVNT